MYDFLKEMKGASDTLQGVDINVCVACDLITNCVDFFNKKRNETNCQQYVNEAKKLCETRI